MSDKIVIYGAGKRGKDIYAFLKEQGMENRVEAFCVSVLKDVEKTIEQKPIYTYESLKNTGKTFVIGVKKTELKEQIQKILSENNEMYYESIEKWAVSQGYDMVKWNRDWCAWYHIEPMKEYYYKAEEKENIAVFWDEKSKFYEMFKMLDLDNVIELAVGHGRHVPQYIEQAKHVTLVDILEENIDFCKDRFQDRKNISYYCNNGFNLCELEAKQYSALFTYDAMVHFEMMDIYEYLKDIYRVLKPGAMALFHHSNNTSDYKLSSGTHMRNYMSKDIFAYLAYRTGFEVVKQEVISWGEQKIICLIVYHC